MHASKQQMETLKIRGVRNLCYYLLVLSVDMPLNKLMDKNQLTDSDFNSSVRHIQVLCMMTFVGMGLKFLKASKHC